MAVGSLHAKRYHVKLISVSENIDLDNDWGYLVVYVLGGLAEYYVRNLSRLRTKGKPGQTQPGPFTRDNIRDMLTNVVYAGVAAHYPSRPLSWDEDDQAGPHR